MPTIIGIAFHLFLFLGIIPLTVLVLNRLFLWAGSPVPILVLSVWSFVMMLCSLHFLWSFHIKGIALELYHFPCCVLADVDHSRHVRPTPLLPAQRCCAGRAGEEASA